MFYQPPSLLPLTPDTLRGFQQDILVDTALLLRGAVKKQLIHKLPELTAAGREMSYLAAFEALKLFRHLAAEQAARMTDLEKTQLAEIETEWCLDILGHLAEQK